ncbi:SAM-dependent methyltransferase [Nocardiopsis sp. TSRI0078]|uniref:class I SAM-dependent methyltransferase n=1 Tax=unclassified Nocardiopsis TaxID=2649073 RepID=UPI00093E27DF|nr:class I SAM-dependent methyltransferase [Nocardiopsis sp. TSRI0078]OKI13761.1 SAM-dependent methyltransferase [Nocardiopsis sp. TSRI0078]
MHDEDGYPAPGRVERRAVDARESARAGRTWWDGAADAYQQEHGAFLGDAEFVWCPEGVTEDEARLLGDPEELRRVRVLEVGCGAGQCGRWLRAQGVREVVGFDLSLRQLQHSRRIDEQTGHVLAAVQADAQRLPFADASFDVVFSSFGAFPFVPSAEDALAEAARVLRPGGRLVFSVTHPIRWSFPDDPGEHGFTVHQSYFDRRAYVEEDDDGNAVYVEHHHTVGDWVRGIARAGLVLRDMVEPEWPEGLDRVWGGWGPVRGRMIPGTAIFSADRP